jgi:PAS domain S-box-containing protein
MGRGGTHLQLRALDDDGGSGSKRMNPGTELLEALPVAVYMTDAEGRITYYNQAAADFWGVRPALGSDKWCGSWRLFGMDGRPLPHDQCPMAMALREGRPIRGIEAIAERPDGTRVPFLPFPTPLRDASGRVTGAINLLVDLSDRRHAEHESAHLAAIVSSSDDAIISKNLDGTITSWNAGATRIFGYEASEMVGQPVLKLIPPELHGEETTILSRLKKGERIDHYETVRVAKDGRRVDVSLTVSPLRDRAGRLIGASKVSRDITERKQTELTQRLLMEELNHRVKNTLATVQAIAGQTLRHAASPAEFIAGFSGRLQALSRAHALLTRRAFQGADVTDVVRDQLLLGTDADDRIFYKGPFVMLGAQPALHLALILHELGTNARKYGALSVAAGNLSVTWSVRTNGGRNLFLEWAERGGPKVSAPSSPGFGTTLIERTLEAHGGEASLQYGTEGVTCKIRLPLPELQRGTDDRSGMSPLGKRGAMLEPAPARSGLAGKRVLVVEDEPLLAMDIEAILTDSGCSVVGPAGNLHQAKRLLDTQGCDAALLDANLAGESVDELAALLTQRRVPFAFVTGHGRDALPRGHRDAVLVGKPFRREEIRSALEVLCYRSTGSTVVQLQPRN